VGRQFTLFEKLKCYDLKVPKKNNYLPKYMILKYKPMGKAESKYTCVLRVRSVLIFFSNAALRLLISSSFFDLYSAK
jgi:hypothetical protein